MQKLLLALLLGSLPVSLYAQSQPFPCQRWGHATAIDNNNTLWIYGGQVRTSPGQSSNTWTNALLSLDLDQNFPAGAPRFNLVQSDTGNPQSPPAVSLAALWASHDGQTLYSYGGEFSDTPSVTPVSSPVYAYNVPSKKWSAVTNLKGDAIQRSAEGATAFAPGLGSNGDALAFYGFGHIDSYSTLSMSNAQNRIYLNSLLQFDLGSQTFRNYSDFSPTVGSSANAGTGNSSVAGVPTYRADYTLTYVPNLGTNNKGILVAIGGGNDVQVIDNAALDVFDIGAGAWTKQATTGSILPPRVNHCAVRGTASVNSLAKHQIFVYGGQTPQMTQQTSDLYILDIPAYAWTYVGKGLPSEPSGRAGHTCDLIGNQMIIMGGYVSDTYLCDSQSAYILNTTSLTYQPSFVAGTVYQTPLLVANITGGVGSASTTGAPAAPTATGSDSNGVNNVNGVNGGTNTNSKDPSMQSDTQRVNLGAIIGGVVGGMIALFFLILGLLFCYRRHRKRARFSHDSFGGHRRIMSDASTIASVDTLESDTAGLMQSRPYSAFITNPSSWLQSSRPNSNDSSSKSSPYQSYQRHSSGGYHSTPTSSISEHGMTAVDVPGPERPLLHNAWEPTELGGIDGLEPSFFGTTHLTPKRQLRVANV